MCGTIEGALLSNAGYHSLQLNTVGNRLFTWCKANCCFCSRLCQWWPPARLLKVRRATSTTSLAAPVTYAQLGSFEQILWFFFSDQAQTLTNHVDPQLVLMRCTHAPTYPNPVLRTRLPQLAWTGRQAGKQAGRQTKENNEKGHAAAGVRYFLLHTLYRYYVPSVLDTNACQVPDAAE